MPRDGNNVFTPLYDWVEDANGTGQSGLKQPFSPERWKEQDDDFATGLSGIPTKAEILAGNLEGGAKHNAVAPPTVNDDSANTSGNGIFQVGATWTDTVTKERYALVDDTPTAAVWTNTTLTKAEADNHEHDDRYYTETETDAQHVAIYGALAVKSGIAHDHPEFKTETEINLLIENADTTDGVQTVDSVSPTGGNIDLSESYLGKTAKADDSDKLNGQVAGYYAKADASNIGGRLGIECETTTDWNDATENGWYKGLNAANAPNSYWFSGLVIDEGGVGWTTQIVHDYSSDNIEYKRSQINGVWGDWVQASGPDFQVYHNQNIDDLVAALNPYFEGAGAPSGGTGYAPTASGADWPIGSWGMFIPDNYVTIGNNASTSGSNLNSAYYNGSAWVSGGVPTGTWKNVSGTGLTGTDDVGYFVRTD